MHMKYGWLIQLTIQYFILVRIECFNTHTHKREQTSSEINKLLHLKNKYYITYYKLIEK